MTPRCLHCAIRQAIENHARISGMVDPETRTVVLDPDTIVLALACVHAEIIASSADFTRREEMLDDADELLRENVDRALKTGLPPISGLQVRQ